MIDEFPGITDGGCTARDDAAAIDGSLAAIELILYGLAGEVDEECYLQSGLKSMHKTIERMRQQLHERELPEPEDDKILDEQ